MSKQEQRIFGVHPVLEALQAGQTMEKILVRKGKQHERIKDIRRIAREEGIPVQEVPDEKLDRLAKQGNHQGVVALAAAADYQELEPLLLQLQESGETPLLLMLDSVTDVRNFGAIARTAEAMGAHALIVPAKGSAALNADAVRTSAGALSHLPVCRFDHLVDAVMLLQAYEVRTVGITEKTTQSLFDLELNGPLCLVMGSEERGIHNQLIRRLDALGGIPMRGQVESLNVSVAAGMALMEIVRQRG